MREYNKWGCQKNRNNNIYIKDLAKIWSTNQCLHTFLKRNCKRKDEKISWSRNQRILWLVINSYFYTYDLPKANGTLLTSQLSRLSRLVVNWVLFIRKSRYYTAK